MQWISDRISAGLKNINFEQLFSLLMLGVERQLMTKTKGKIWF
jgi:hypothetical protein